MWEILAELFKQILASSLSAGVGAGIGALTSPARGGNGGGFSNPTYGMPMTGQASSQAVSKNSLGGLTGSAPTSASTIPGASEPTSAGTGFASLGPSLLTPRAPGGFRLPGADKLGI